MLRFARNDVFHNEAVHMEIDAPAVSVLCGSGVISLCGFAGVPFVPDYLVKHIRVNLGI